MTPNTISNLTEILSDLNLTIADIETVAISMPGSPDLRRAVGQLKAARTSIVRVISGREIAQ